MKPKVIKLLSLSLAGMLQLAPVLRSVIPTAASPAGALILRWAAGGVALFGYHAISGASSISITPPTATIGTPYNGTITYSGSHAGSVSSMSMSNTCLGSHILAPGLNIAYSSGHIATVSGTPTGTSNTLTFTVKVWDNSGCSGSLSDTRSTAITIQNAVNSNTVPSMTVTPQSIIAQVGSDLILSGGAIGNPPPQYYWKQGLTAIPGALTNTLLIPSAQLTNAAVYTLVASNSNGVANAACWLTMALTPGSNILAYQFTNYIVAGTPVTMSSFITNVPAGVSTYDWQYNFNSIGVTTSNLSLTGAQTTPAKSGTYTVNFNSTVSGNLVVSNQSYDSYWLFGFLPVVTNAPAPVAVGAGSNATFNVTIAGSSFPTLLWYKNTNTLVATQTNLAATYNPSTASATTNFSLTLSNVSPSDAGNYTVVVTNYWGSTTSAPALLTVNSALSVSAPQGQTNYAGKNISFTVTPSGTPPFGYQWQKDLVNLSNAGPISGANTNTLVIFPAATTNTGNFAVIVTNGSGSVTSAVAALSILPLPQFTITPGGGNVTLNAAGGVVGSNYVVQVTTNVANSAGWVPIKTNVVPLNGVISFTDSNTSNSSQRYYRVQFP